MYDPMHERITVYVHYSQTETPIVERFFWRGKEHKITEQSMITKAKKGNEVVWLFYVSTQTGAYKLRFNTGSLEWYLEELTWEETR